MIEMNDDLPKYHSGGVVRSPGGGWGIDEESGMFMPGSGRDGEIIRRVELEIGGASHTNAKQLEAIDMVKTLLKDEIYSAIERGDATSLNRLTSMNVAEFLAMMSRSLRGQDKAEGDV